MISSNRKAFYHLLNMRFDIQNEAKLKIKYKYSSIICTGGGEVKTNVYIRFGDDTNYRNVNTLTDEEKKLAGNKLNQQAAERIVLVPKTA